MSHECGYYCQGDVHAIGTMVRRGVVPDIEEARRDFGERCVSIHGKWYAVVEVLDMKPAREAAFVPDESWSAGGVHKDGTPMITFIRVGQEVE